MGLNQYTLQQIRNQILGNPDGPFGDLEETIYLQQIIKALLGQPQTGPYGSLDRSIYIQRIRDVLTLVLANYPKGNLLRTGQSTSYGSGSGVDDGALKIGLAKQYQILITGQYAGNTNIAINSKTDAHGNACVFDVQTGLMWSRTWAGSVGPASDGKLPWTTTGAGATAEGIFPYAAAANAARLAGYGNDPNPIYNWRVPNRLELESIMDCEAPTGIPDAVAFPAFGTTPLWTSSTVPNGTTTAFIVNPAIGAPQTDAKTSANYRLLLVRTANP